MNLLNGFDIDLAGVDGQEIEASRLTTFHSLVSEIYGQDIKIESVVRLRSKKNIVLHIDLNPVSHAEASSFIVKMFIADTFQNEMNQLSASLENGLTVPKVLAAQDGVILMEFIPGEPLVDRVNQTFDPVIVELLAKWYYKYHRIDDRIKGDPRLRNFIWNNGQIFGLDFEESRKEHWMLDIAGVSASLLDTDPIFDARKRVLAWNFLDYYLSLRNMVRTSEIESIFIEKMADTLAQTAEWRNDERIMELSNRVRLEGLEVE